MKITHLLTLSLVGAVLAIGAFSYADQWADDAVVIPLKVIAGGGMDGNGKVYAVPVTVGGQTADFTWNCTGPTYISESFARQIGARVDQGVANIDASVFVGTAGVTLTIGGHSWPTEAWVMRDSVCQVSEKNGVIGADMAGMFQWTMDPRVPSLTMRRLGSPPTSQPIAVLPLKDLDQGPGINVNIRNVAIDVELMPSGSTIQAGPKLQHLWDLKGSLVVDRKNLPKVGNVLIMDLHGRDRVQLTKNITETDMPCSLLGDPNHPELTPLAFDGIGSCLLDRFVYTVDTHTHEFRIMARINNADTQPSIRSLTNRPPTPRPAHP